MYQQATVIFLLRAIFSSKSNVNCNTCPYRSCALSTFPHSSTPPQLFLIVSGAENNDWGPGWWEHVFLERESILFSFRKAHLNHFYMYWQDYPWIFFFNQQLKLEIRISYSSKILSLKKKNLTNMKLWASYYSAVYLSATTVHYSPNLTLKLQSLLKKVAE